jgi:hypothetical protein
LPGKLSTPVWQFAPDSSLVTTDESNVSTRWTGINFQEKGSVPKWWEMTGTGPRSSDWLWDAVVSSNNVVRVRDVRQGKLVNQFAVTMKFPARPLQFLDHNRILLVGYDGSADIDEWDISTGKKVLSAQGVRDHRVTLFSSDGRHCLSYNSPEAAVLKSLTDGRQAQLNLDPKGESFLQDFSPDSRLLAVPSQYGYANVFSVDPPGELATLRGFLLGVHSVGFSPDSARIAVGSGGREAVKLWDAASLQELITLGAEGSMFMRTRFSPDGNVLGSVSASSGVLYLWRAPSWEEIHGTEAKEKAEAHEALLKQAADLANSAPSLPLNQVYGTLATWQRMAETLWASNEKVNAAPLVNAFVGGLERLSAANPEDTDRIKQVAMVQLWLGHTNEYVTACRKLLQLSAASKEPTTLDRAAKTCLVWPQLDSDLLKKAVYAGHESVKVAGENHPFLGYLRTTSALASLREGKPADAETMINLVLSQPVAEDCRVLALACRALARAQVSRKTDARSDLESVAASLPKSEARPAPSQVLLRPDLMAAELLSEEARALLDSPPTSTKP